MSDDQFWSLIDRSRAGAADQEAQLAAARRMLMAMDAGQVLGFGGARERQMVRAYTWNLWGAAYLIGGGASDDGFEYFRSWLISNGRAAFEGAIANPDGLADWVPDTDGMLPEFEALEYVDRDVWAAKTGRDAGDYPNMERVEPREPTGDKLREEPAWLAIRYPKLWKRFGANSLT